MYVHNYTYTSLKKPYVCMCIIADSLQYYCSYMKSFNMPQTITVFYYLPEYINYNINDIYSIIEII